MFELRRVSLPIRLIFLALSLFWLAALSVVFYRKVVWPMRVANLTRHVWYDTEGYRLESLRAALEQGGDPNARDIDGWPALVAAANNGNPACVEMLLKHKANPELTNPAGNTALMQAARNVPLHHGGGPNGYEESGLILCRYGAGVKPPSPRENGPLMYAISGGSPRLVGAMIDRGADPNLKSATQGTPLQLAISMRRTAVAGVLIDKGAKMDLADKTDTTPFMFAAEVNRADIFKMMVAKGADLRYKNKSGSTILMAAAFGGNPDLIRLALDAGVDVNAIDSSKDTAITCAIRGKHPEVVPMLKQAGETR